MWKIKICGTTTLQDAKLAVDAGADAIGFVLYSKSPRAVTVDTVASIVVRLPAHMTTVGVFVDEDLDTVRQIVKDAGLKVAQLHGQETPEYCSMLGGSVVKAIRVQDASDCDALSQYHVRGLLFDTHVRGTAGGTGTAFNWDLLTGRPQSCPVLLAGGLTPDNVHDAIMRVRPAGVDVSSGVEQSPGKKDPQKVRAFVAAARAAFERIAH